MSWNPNALRCEDELQWLEMRRRTPEWGATLTASDSRGILLQGYSGECPMSIWSEKIDTTPITLDEEVQERFEIGHLLEPVLTQVFKRRAGIAVKMDRAPVLRQHRDWPWMMATLDAWYYWHKQLIPVEFKSTGAYTAHEWEDNQVPLRVQIQVQHQMAVCNAPYAWVVCWAGPDQIYHRMVSRDSNFIEALIRKLLEFKHLCDEQIPPPADWTVACEKALMKLHPQDNGLAVQLPEEVVPMVDELQEVKEQIKKLEQQERALKNAVRAMMGPCSYGLLPDGRGFSWLTQEVSEHKVKAHTKRVLLGPKKLPKGLEIATPERLEKINEYGQATTGEGTGKGDELRADGGEGADRIEDQRGAEVPLQAEQEREAPF